MINMRSNGWQATPCLPARPAGGPAGRISDDFTFETIRKIGGEIIGYLQQNKLTGRPLIVGYDARFLSDRFAAEIVKLAEKGGLSCLLAEADAPFPVLAWSVKDRGASLAAMISGGDSPAEVSGVKIFPKVEIKASGEAIVPKKPGKVERFHPRERYLKFIESQIDVAAIKRAKLKLVVDPMFGSGRGYIDRLVQIEEIHESRDVLFGGRSPQPTAENLSELREKVLSSGADLGLALNGDASDFAVIDAQGNYLHPPVKDGDGILSALLEVEKLARERI